MKIVGEELSEKQLLMYNSFNPLKKSYKKRSSKYGEGSGGLPPGYTPYAIILGLALFLSACAPAATVLPSPAAQQYPDSPTPTALAYTATPTATTTLTPIPSPKETSAPTGVLAVKPETVRFNVLAEGVQGIGGRDVYAKLSSSNLINGDHYILELPWYRNAPTSLELCADPSLLISPGSAIGFPQNSIELALYDPYTNNIISRIPLDRVGNSTTFCSQRFGAEAFGSDDGPFAYNQYGLVGIKVIEHDLETVLIDFGAVSLTLEGSGDDNSSGGPIIDNGGGGGDDNN